MNDIIIGDVIKTKILFGEVQAVTTRGIRMTTFDYPSQTFAGFDVFILWDDLSNSSVPICHVNQSLDLFMQIYDGSSGNDFSKAKRS